VRTVLVVLVGLDGPGLRSTSEQGGTSCSICRRHACHPADPGLHAPHAQRRGTAHSATHACATSSGANVQRTSAPREVIMAVRRSAAPAGAARRASSAKGRRQSAAVIHLYRAMTK
jgi:hypothetical protein